ncbi:MAG: hypothetical protein MJA29_03165 [Candidatus Omnitrophica bacterium]|nr:hypothetical protein [Candidatus Omnitrophota bacterium]
MHRLSLLNDPPRIDSRIESAGVIFSYGTNPVLILNSGMDLRSLRSILISPPRCYVKILLDNFGVLGGINSHIDLCSLTLHKIRH